LHRRELKLKIYHNAATPSRAEVKKIVALKFNVDPDLVVVDNMKSEFGKGETKAYIKVYESADAAKLVERAHILKRNMMETGGEASEDGGGEASEDGGGEASEDGGGEASEDG